MFIQKIPEYESLLVICFNSRVKSKASQIVLGEKTKSKFVQNVLYITSCLHSQKVYTFNFKYTTILTLID